MLPRRERHPHAVALHEAGTDSKEGARKAPSFALWAGIVVFGLLMAIAIGLPGLMVAAEKGADPIHELARSAGGNCPPGTCRTSLVPKFFAHGETRESVDRRLRDAGYGVRDATTYYKEEFYNPRRYLFDTLACEVLYVVEVQFDDTAHLVGATGDADGGCY